jgi:hypothetical protein
LISRSSHIGKYMMYIFPIEASDLIIRINHLVIPIGKEVAERI